MLVLTRKKGETIIIGEEIEVTVLDIKGDNIKIGISAPKSVSIVRKEIYLAVKEENTEALQSNRHNLKDIAKIIKIESEK